MSRRRDSVPVRGRTGRRSGDSGTREAILAAARERFGDRGYEGATIRAIAADAGVDPALVYHFYGSKERLFAAAMRVPAVAGEVVAAALAPRTRDPGGSPGEHLMRAVLGAWEVTEIRSVFLGLLRSAVTSGQAAAMLRELSAGPILSGLTGMGRGGEPGPGEGEGAGGDPEFRAALVASQVLGLALVRYVLRLPPLASADPEKLAAAVGPALERYLSGDLRPPAA
jgi:AcrR family transcriptional regulator